MAFFLKKHTPSLYVMDELASLFQKAVRLGEVDLAVWAAAEMMRAGYSRYTWSKLLNFACEDIGLGAPSLVEHLLVEWKAWEAVLKRTQTKVGEAWRVPELTQPLLQAAAITARCRKSRMVATCSGFLYSLTDPPRRSADDVETKETGWPALERLWTRVLTSGDKERVLSTAHWLHVLVSHLSKAQQRTAALHYWQPLVAHVHDQPRLRTNVLALQELWFTHLGSKHMGAPRLTWMHAALAVVYAADWTTSPITDWSRFDVKAVVQRMQEQVLDPTLDPLRTRLYAIPRWAFADKHTARGRSLKSNTDALATAAAALGVTATVAQWTDEEKAKSHRVNDENPSEHKGETQVAAFFHHGAATDPRNTWYPGDEKTDPYAERCEQWYLAQEKQYGFRQAKSKFMVQRLWQASETGQAFFVREWHLPVDEFAAALKTKTVTTKKRRVVETSSTADGADKRTRRI